MAIRLFGWTIHIDREVPPPQAPPTEPMAVATESMCPPCTGRCFQGRACPAAPGADPNLVALMRRSPLQ